MHSYFITNLKLLAASYKMAVNFNISYTSARQEKALHTN